MRARGLLDSHGAEAPPRSNGELVFRAPWESRAFGLAVRLHEAGVLDWEDFRRRLIEEIGAWEASHPSDADYDYYRLWLRALERTLLERGLLSGTELAARRRELLARPHGHDHAPPG